MNKLDILSREEFVDRLISLTENISRNNTHTSFAIDGAWGCGKSFVLDMFEEKLSQYQSEITATDKYFIVRYNCWKYDYYEEPLIAIVAALIDGIEEKTKVIPDSQDKQEICGMLKATAVALLTMLNEAVKTKTGLDIKEAADVVLEGSKKGKEKHQKDHAYDVYFSFKKVMRKLHELVGNLTQKFTVVFLVDELDRCLPEYAIKILERLHHISEGSSNLITIISVDKTHLSTSIKRIFGFDNPEEYLRKFINFEVVLDCGVISDKISEKYADYIELFDKNVFPFDESIEEFMREIFANIDVRTQEQLVKRAMLAHTLLFSEKKDYSFMCMELLLTVLICIYNNDSCLGNIPVLHTTVDKMFNKTKGAQPPQFAIFLSKHFKIEELRRSKNVMDNSTSYILPENNDLYAAIIYTWYWMHNTNTDFDIRYKPQTGYDSIKNNPEQLKKFAETIRMIK